ncbi:hypothetical protein E2320_004862, partial [Naja naja]
LQPNTILEAKSINSGDLTGLIPVHNMKLLPIQISNLHLPTIFCMQLSFSKIGLHRGLKELLGHV